MGRKNRNVQKNTKKRSKTLRKSDGPPVRRLPVDEDDLRDSRLKNAVNKLLFSHSLNAHFLSILGRMIHCYDWVKPMPQDVAFKECKCCIEYIHWDKRTEIVQGYDPDMFESDLLSFFWKAGLVVPDAEYLISLPFIIDERLDKNSQLKASYEHMKPALEEC